MKASRIGSIGSALITERCVGLHGVGRRQNVVLRTTSGQLNISNGEQAAADLGFYVDARTGYPLVDQFMLGCIGRYW